MSIVIGIEKETKKRIHIKDYIDENVLCPSGHKLVAKKGCKRVHHYSHVGNVDCFYGSKGKTDFHLWWQSRIKPKYLEIRMENHIADICIKGFVIEIQHSSIGKDQIKERENFYGNMCWIFDGLETNFTEEAKFKNLVKFKIFGGKSDFLHARKDVYIDKGVQGLYKILRKEKKNIWCKKIALSKIDKVLFKNKLIPGADIRSDRPYFDLSNKATKDEIKNFIKT